MYRLFYLVLYGWWAWSFTYKRDKSESNVLKDKVIMKLMSSVTVLPKVHCRVRKTSLYAFILSQMNPLNILTRCFFFEIRFMLSWNLYLGFSSTVLPSGCPIKITCAFVISHATPISSWLVTSPQWSVRRTHHYAVFAKHPESVVFPWYKRRSVFLRQQSETFT